jgi:methylglutamate dehydrogenase subunit D
MVDFQLVSRAALAGKSPFETTGISLKALPEGLVLHVLAKPGGRRPSQFEQLSNAAHSVRDTAPGQWFIVADEPLPQSKLELFLEQLRPDAYGVDQSHGRIRIAISGSSVERVLAKGTGVDLAISQFPVHHSATTLLGHIATHITRVGEDSFELIVLRSFAESLWDDLVRMSLPSASKF